MKCVYSCWWLELDGKRLFEAEETNQKNENE